MFPMPPRPAIAANGVPAISSGVGSSASASSPARRIVSPKLVANASSTGRSATRCMSTQPLGPTVVSVVANVAASPVSPTTSVCAACASSSNCSRSRAVTVGSDAPSSATHSAVWRAISQLTGPSDCSNRMTCPRSICERSIFERSNSPPPGPPPNRKAGTPGMGESGGPEGKGSSGPSGSPG